MNPIQITLPEIASYHYYYLLNKTKLNSVIPDDPPIYVTNPYLNWPERGTQLNEGHVNPKYNAKNIYLDSKTKHNTKEAHIKTRNKNKNVPKITNERYETQTNNVTTQIKAI